MSNYKAKISKDNEGSFYAYIVRVDYDGEESVINSYDGRHFQTRKGAERSTSKYIQAYC